MKIGFIGLGIMGKPMAKNLLVDGTLSIMAGGKNWRKSRFANNGKTKVPRLPKIGSFLF